MKLEPKPLAWWIEHLSDMPRDAWLWITSDTRKIEPDTICFPIDSGRDLSPEEQDQRDIDLEESGKSCFLHRDQLEDIKFNLQEQVSRITPDQLYAAINHYWSHDAFIEIDST